MDILETLKNYNIVKTGHFKLTSGKHSMYYVNKDSIWLNHECASAVLHSLVLKADDISSAHPFDFITGPAVAGAMFAVVVSVMFSVPFVYPEKDSQGNMVFRRGFDKFIKGKRGLIIEDIITTGGSLKKTADGLAACGAEATAGIVIWNRTGEKPIPYVYSLVDEPITSYDPSDCPLCKNGTPLTDPKA